MRPVAGRIWLPRLVVLVAVAVAAPSAPSLARAAERLAHPNVVLVTIDTLRADHVSAYGYRQSTTPNLDKIAREGVLFENAYATANSTNPSHTSIFTGTWVTTHRVADTPAAMASGRIRTLASRLHDGGYRTAAVVSAVHLNAQPSGLSAGFDEYFDTAPNTTERRAAESVALARTWIGAHARKPFFLWLHLFDAHARYDPPAPFDTRFVTQPSARLDVILHRLSSDAFFSRTALPAQEQGKLRAQFAAAYVDSIVFNGIGLTPAEVEYLIALYDGEVAYADDELGRLFGDLDRLKIAGNTLLVVTSDHGESLGEHGVYSDHRTLHEEILRVPLIARWPGRVPSGRRVADVARSIDIVPTVLEYTGMPGDAAIEGRSLIPLVAGTGKEGPRPAFAELNHFFASSVTIHPWKLVLPHLPRVDEVAPSPSERAQILKLLPPAPVLFDLRNVSREEASVAAEHPELVERLRRQREELTNRAALTPAQPGPTVDPDTRERLRALGYGE